jgi:tyrosine-specific transport protein
MNRQFGAMFIVAGTSIGAGIIALPMVLASIGFIPTLLLMVTIWWLMYRSSLVNLELILQSGRPLDLGSVGQHYGSPTAAFLGECTLLALMYALMGAYFYGFSSLAGQMFSLPGQFHWMIVAGLSVVFVFAMSLPIQGVDRINRALFAALLCAGLMFLLRLCGNVRWNGALLRPHGFALKTWLAAVPVVFTSFGFHVVFAALSEYCAMNRRSLRRVFFYGSLIPAVVYCIWVQSTLLAIHGHSPHFFEEMAAGRADVGAMVDELSSIAHGGSIRSVVWSLSILAIITSIIGVGMGLCNSLERHLAGTGLPRIFKTRSGAVITAAVPSALLAIAVPRAFTAILGVAGIILAILAIFLPLYLLRRGNFKIFHYAPVGRSSVRLALLVGGSLVIVCELLLVVL